MDKLKDLTAYILYWIDGVIVLHFLRQRLGFNPRTVYMDSEDTKCHRFWFLPQSMHSAVSCQSSFLSHSHVFVKTLQSSATLRLIKTFVSIAFPSIHKFQEFLGLIRPPSAFLVSSGLKKVNFSAA